MSGIRTRALVNKEGGGVGRRAGVGWGGGGCLSLGELRQSAGKVCELQRTGFSGHGRNPKDHRGVVVGSHSNPARVLVIRE